MIGVMIFRALAVLLCATLWSGCSQDDAGPRDRGLPDSAAPDLFSPDSAADMADAAGPDSGPDAAGAPPCPKGPCAARPIIFIHGFAGSNHDWLPMLKELASKDPRYDGHRLSGVLDHEGWAARSVDRRRWLFAFDYYIKKSGDGRGSYTAGPGRIGSKTSFACPSPSGSGYLVATKAAYDAGTNHDYAADLHSLINNVLSATGATEVDVVAHSMGGLVLRSYLSFYGGAARVDRVLLLASPVKGVKLATFLGLFTLGFPKWMKDHEAAELDGGTILSQIRFRRCGEGAKASPGAWAAKLLDHEKLYPPKVALHVMTGQLDITISYNAAHHPQAKSHQVVSLADHPGILKKAKTRERVTALLGGSYK